MAPVAKEAWTINRDVAQENEPLFSGAGRDRPRKRRLGKSKGAGVPQPDSVERCSPVKDRGTGTSRTGHPSDSPGRTLGQPHPAHWTS